MFNSNFRRKPVRRRRRNARGVVSKGGTLSHTCHVPATSTGIVNSPSIYIWTTLQFLQAILISKISVSVVATRNTDRWFLVRTIKLRFYTEEIQNYQALSFSHRISIDYKNYRVIIWLLVVLYHVTCECAQQCVTFQMLRLRENAFYSNWLVHHYL